MKKKPGITEADPYQYFDRDISWLSFNERVLDEAQRSIVPLMERVRFLAIYSSNLDEFYRVRMPALTAVRKISSGKEKRQTKELLNNINSKILGQQKYFGSVIENQILNALRQHSIHLLYNEQIPEAIKIPVRDYFIHTVASYLCIHHISKPGDFFPENNKLYLLIRVQEKETQKNERLYVINIPSDIISRFHALSSGETQYILFLDDIIKINLPEIFKGQTIIGCNSFKTTRDAELDLEDEFTGNLGRKIEKKIHQRDKGDATRFLYEPGIPVKTLKWLKHNLNLGRANFIPGGAYHNLKDLSHLPLKDPQFYYEPWPQVRYPLDAQESVFECIKRGDILLHPPYHSYETILRFFNEAAIDIFVQKIYVTLYRVASDSRIVNALINAAKNGKKVIVFVELKARFDEANNLKWSKLMRAAGVRIIESIPGLKVHAKLALVKRKNKEKVERFGIIATGNFNETTAKYYTDHVFLTANSSLLKESENLFHFLKKRVKPSARKSVRFNHLLVGQFNLQERFIELIDREISNAKKGKEASIIIKLNNLEDRVLISKLYDASKNGVKISLLVRSVCCLVPGVKGMSENISVKRIIDRYLEHGRIFIFHNDNDPDIVLGSADWMNRNIYRRIEVCFPLKDQGLKAEVLKIINLQLQDNQQAVFIDGQCSNTSITDDALSIVRSQKVIGEMIAR
jgi:polyphosphate kinase